MIHAVSACLIIIISLSALIFDADIYRQGNALIVGANIPPFQLHGVIFGNYSRHEYMHVRQQLNIGEMEYYATVVAPSLLTNMYVLCFPAHGVCERRQQVDWYHALPWEHL